MCTEDIYLAGRYNKFVRNLSQTPWTDGSDCKITESVKELIEDGLTRYLQFDKAVFSSSGREDVDVRMLGRGRPFVFKLINLWKIDDCDADKLMEVQNFVNEKSGDKIRVRDLQVVTKKGVDGHLKDGQESKTKDYRAYCCCTRKLDANDIKKVSEMIDLNIKQKTPIRVLHRRSLATRTKKIHSMKLNIDVENMPEFANIIQKELDRVFTLDLQAEAGTYIKEFVHGDFGRTDPCLSSILTDCDTDLFELDVMEVNLDWPQKIDEIETKVVASSSITSEKPIGQLDDESIESQEQEDCSL